MKKEYYIIIVLVLIILVGSIVMANNKIKDNILQKETEAYNLGFNDGQITFYNQLIVSLSQNGEVTIPITQNNQTINVRLGIIQRG